MQQFLNMQLSRQILPAGCPRDACILLAALPVHQSQMYRLTWQLVGELNQPLCAFCAKPMLFIWIIRGTQQGPGHVQGTIPAQPSVLLGDIMDNFFWRLAQMQHIVAHLTSSALACAEAGGSARPPSITGSSCWPHSLPLPSQSLVAVQRWSVRWRTHPAGQRGSKTQLQEGPANCRELDVASNSRA